MKYISFPSWFSSNTTLKTTPSISSQFWKIFIMNYFFFKQTSVPSPIVSLRRNKRFTNAWERPRPQCSYWLIGAMARPLKDEIQGALGAEQNLLIRHVASTCFRSHLDRHDVTDCFCDKGKKNLLLIEEELAASCLKNLAIRILLCDFLPLSKIHVFWIVTQRFEFNFLLHKTRSTINIYYQ